MQFYLAPMEGLTGYIFRNAYHKYFNNIDKYFTPFIASTGLNHKERNDVLPEHNEGLEVVPQILTNRADDFLEIAMKMKAFGYSHVNLNLGCPSGTVVSKKRGAGFLGEPALLDDFLDRIFSKCPLSVSIKTRIGLESEKEWEGLLQIYRKYPVEELIVHPRVQKDFYKNRPRYAAWEQAERTLSCPLCYNGDIHSVDAYKEFMERFPQTCRIMLGRGILKDPFLVKKIKGEAPADAAPDLEVLEAFHEELLEGYRQVMSGDTNTLYKMKELWVYLGESFPEEQFSGSGKLLKRIRKASSIPEYQAAVALLFRLK